MPLVALSHVSHRYGGPYVVEDVTVEVEKGRRIGVIGQNGTGKSTLLRMLAGELEPTQGDVLRRRGVRVAFQAQELQYAPGATVRDEMLRLFADDIARGERLRRLEQQLAAAPEEDQTRLLGEYSRVQQEHQARDGYGIERRIETVLMSLGLPRDAWDQPVDHFSGGERNIVGLAGVLLAAPDVMLLDEPSNHLDVEGIEWFTDFLRNTTAAFVMVSHNRYLLDTTVNEIWEVRRGGVTRWTGNYSSYKEQKAKALELQERRYRNQQRTIERLAFQARRLKDMANAYDDPAQAKRAKSMERRIERMDKEERPDRAEDRFHASLKGGKRHGHIALQVRDFTFTFDERVLFHEAELDLDYGDRVCLVGPNGSGKTTLIRQVLEHGSWENGTLRLGKAVKVGEYKQLHDDALDPRATLLDWTMDATGLARTPASDLLHRFLFSRDDLDRAIGTLSGGEKSRVQLARLVHEKVNFLVLDEPTNHLDLQACEQLEAMLHDFDGTLLVISHDRYFLEKLVNRVVEVKDRGLHLFRGGFAAWWEAKKEARDGKRRAALELRSRKGDAEHRESASEHDREERKTQQREHRRLKREMNRVEARIEVLEAERDTVTNQLEAAFSGDADPEEGRRLTETLATVEAELTDLYRTWEETAEALEQG